jgi:predicted transposase/invertase (TIGR01784 family)
MLRDTLIKKIEEERRMFSKSKEKEIYKIGLELRQMDEQIMKKEAETEGKIEGIKEGRKEGMMDMAFKLKNMGFSLEEIRSITGLSAEELKNINLNI